MSNLSSWRKWSNLRPDRPGADLRGDDRIASSTSVCVIVTSCVNVILGGSG